MYTSDGEIIIDYSFLTILDEPEVAVLWLIRYWFVVHDILTVRRLGRLGLLYINGGFLLPFLLALDDYRWGLLVRARFRSIHVHDSRRSLLFLLL